LERLPTQLQQNLKSGPPDILRAITLSKATVRKMTQNLGWATVYNVLAIPAASPPAPQRER
jgi:cation transport ATPase